ncbi:hypothetical protein ACQ4PT_045754 [Festuca glaucescens]
MDAACESCALWRDHCYWDHRKDEKKPQFSVVASDDFKKSVVTYTPKNFIPFEGQDLTPLKLNAPNDIMYDVVVIWEMGQAVLRSGWDAFVTAHQIQENDTFLFMYLGDSNFEIQQAAPNPGQVHMPIEFDYTMSTGCHLTPEQDDKVLEIARTIRSEIPLYVAMMNKINVNIEDCFINIPLQLVDHFKDGTASTTIKLVAPNCHIYTVGASKHSEDQFVLRSGWGAFVVANRIQKNDLLIFSSKEKTRLKVLALDPSGCQKISPYVAMEDVSNTGEDSVQITDPPPRTIETIDLTSSDDDHIVREDGRRSPRWQKHVPGCGPKTRKIASTSSPHTQSGHSIVITLQYFITFSSTCGYAVFITRMAHFSGSNDLQGPSRLPYILAKRVNLTGALEKKVQEKVQSIGSELPVYVAVMTKTCVSSVGRHSNLKFCEEYASAYLPSSGQTLTLQLEDKEWHTTLYVIPKRKAIHEGWSKFASDNDLRLGDICLFAKRSTASLAMRVHFVRKSGVLL